MVTTRRQTRKRKGGGAGAEEEQPPSKASASEEPSPQPAEAAGAEAGEEEPVTTEAAAQPPKRARTVSEGGDEAGEGAPAPAPEPVAAEGSSGAGGEGQPAEQPEPEGGKSEGRAAGQQEGGEAEAAAEEPAAHAAAEEPAASGQQEGGEGEPAAERPAAATEQQGDVEPASKVAEAVQKGEERRAEVPRMIEEGKVSFLYRPKVGKEEVASLGDVQRFFMLLSPARPGTKSRLCVLGKKRLPSARRHERFFGFVEACADDPQELLHGLGEKSYETKTRGTRHLAACRLLGQGTYGIAEHHDHVKLLYKLEVPATPGEAQLEFVIGEEGAFIFTVKNPERQRPQDPGLGAPADYPTAKQEEFEDYRWIPVRDTQLLDYKRCEFLLVGAREEMPPGSGEQLEQVGGEAECSGAESDEECLLGKMKEEMQVEQLGLDTTPAETGHLA